MGYFTLKSLVSKSLKFEIKRKISIMKWLINSYKIWQWRECHFNLGTSDIKFLGNPDHLTQLQSLLGFKASENLADRCAVTTKLLATDFPLPNAICIPSALNTIVKLNRTVEEILASYSRSLRRSIQGQRSEYRYETVTSIEKIAQIEAQMLKPYANARHEHAHHLGLDVVINMATSDYGRLDVLYCGDEAVGCHLGNSYERTGKKYWHVNRFGYPEKIFSDFKRWGEVNSMNLHLALETAIANAYDFCDYGASLARPGAGLIEWKRRRKGFLVDDCSSYFYVKVPEDGAALFFLGSPLFAIEKKGITLHLGVPANQTDEEVMARYHEMGYGGLSKVYLHCLAKPKESLVKAIHDLYQDQNSQPEMVIVC